MPRVSPKRLTRIWQEESAGKTKQMLEACRRRKEGRSIRGTAREMGLAYSTVRDWLVRVRTGNLGRRFDCKCTGRKRMLTGAVLAYIKRWLNGNPQRYEFEAGPEMSRAPAPPADAPESDTLYADQALVAHPVVGGSVAETERPPVGAPAAPPDQSPATSHTPAGDRAGTEADPHGPVPPLAAGLRPDSRAAMVRVPPLPRTITDPDHVLFRGKPPPAVSA